MKKEETMDEETILQNMKRGLTGWYPFPEGARILYAGEEAESWAPYGICGGGERQIDCCRAGALPEKLAAGENGYDYIVMIETAELSEEPGELLSMANRLLGGEGTLLLGMNNRLGIRYFCGDRDKYTGRNFDGIENYRRAYAKKEDVFRGRMYADSEIKKMAAAAGFSRSQSFAVFPDLRSPAILIAEGYCPNEDLSGRIFPVYEAPELLYLEEEFLYKSLQENGLFHGMANAFLLECRKGGETAGVLQVTSSLERDKKDAFFTVIYGKEGKAERVEKIPAFQEGKKRLAELEENSACLAGRGIRTVPVRVTERACEMPYAGGETGQAYLKKLLLKGKMEEFYRGMDRFRDLIFRSSALAEPDHGDGKGAVLQKGFWDLVPLNSLYEADDFVVFDQEFVQENLPANVLLFRMVATFYHASPECQRILPQEALYDRYGLTERLEEWRKAEWEFLTGLRNEEPLAGYHQKHWRNGEQVHANRLRMNYPLEEYEKKFVHIFEHADTRKLILFGSGSFAEYFLKIYGRDYQVYAIVDNAASRWGMEVGGVKVESPDILKQLDSGEYKVLICIKNYLSVMKQLEEMGVGDYAVYDRNRSYPRRLAPAALAESGVQEKKKYHVGYVAGAFDMFHAGHLNLLRRAKEQCDYLIAGVLPDELIRELKGKDPVIKLKERVEIVASCRYVDHAEGLPEGYAGIKEAWRMFRFDVQFSGDDHNEDEAWLADKAFLEKQGADIVFIPYTQGVSSTMLRERLHRGEDGR